MPKFSPITDSLNYPSFVNLNSAAPSTIILCDFDGTISLDDVTDILLDNFADEEYEQIEQQWLAGEIGSQECMSKQIALMSASKREIDDVLANVEIDPHFNEFVGAASQNNVALHVVSDGLDYAIKSILQRHQLFLPVFANQLLFDNEKHWQIAFPYHQPNCIKASGNCKCHHLFEQYNHYNHVIYVGDGASDYCVSGKASIVFAKDKLINYCQKNSLNYLPMSDFSDATRFLLEQLKKPR